MQEICHRVYKWNWNIYNKLTNVLNVKVRVSQTVEHFNSFPSVCHPASSIRTTFGRRSPELSTPQIESTGQKMTLPCSSVSVCLCASLSLAISWIKTKQRFATIWQATDSSWFMVQMRNEHWSWRSVGRSDQEKYTWSDDLEMSWSEQII